MSYRVECAVSGRAGCKQTECQQAQIKIEKDELRLGTWVEFERGGGWQWRHWGCVTGKILENLRKAIENPNKPGEYLWDMLDGYDSGDKGSLDSKPDYQEKVRRVITQGFIDPEDFNGDPEMNRLGEKGIRTAASKKKAKEDKIARSAEINELQSKLAAAEAELADLKARGDHSAKKVEKLRDAVKHELEEKEEEKKMPVVVKRVKQEDDEEARQPLKKKRATKAKGVKKEEDSEDDFASAPAPKKRANARGAAVKKEENESGNDLLAVSAPAPKKRASRAKKAATKDESDTDGDVTATEVPAPSKRPSRAKKAAAKNEPIEDNNSEVAPAPKKRASRARRAAKEEAVVDEGKENEDARENAVEEEEVEVKPKARRGRKKATA